MIDSDGITPRVVIAETHDPAAALGYFALILGDGSVEFVEHGEMIGMTMPLSAFWRMVDQLEAGGFRDGREPPAPAEVRRGHPCRVDSVRVRDRIERAVALRAEGKTYAEIASILDYASSTSVGNSVRRYVRQQAMEVAD